MCLPARNLVVKFRQFINMLTEAFRFFRAQAQAKAVSAFCNSGGAGGSGLVQQVKQAAGDHLGGAAQVFEQ
ncbi:MAG: hypothetical protein RLZZ352_720 [Pseudomonadota bacterium]|jgi:hypothetical protein